MVIALANEMTERGHEAGLLTWDRADAEAFYPMSPAVRWHKLDIGGVQVKAGPLTRLQRAVAARKFTREFRPDIVLAFQSGTFRAIRLYCAAMNIPMLVTERNALTMFDHVSVGEKGRQEAFGAYRMADFVVVQCEAYRQMYPAEVQNKLLVIPNPVYPAKVMANPAEPNAKGRLALLSVGRLSRQKNFASLIEAFALASAHLPEWDLVIVGEGEDRGKLEEMIRRVGLDARLVLPGETKDPAAYYASSHLFCLPSRWEGFPNALAEAMAHGLPAVGFADSDGVNQLIASGKSGLLAAGNGDTEALAGALERLMRDAELRSAMGREARAAMSQYEPKIVMDRWEEVFRSVVS